jgi:7-cyano-7-deazaguanine synthase in queuosine biosynthesis
MKTLLAFSGGLDSTYVLWKLLNTTDDEITTLTIDFRLSPIAKDVDVELCGYQEFASRRIVSWLKENVREFKHIEKHAFDMLSDEEESVYFIRRAVPWLNDGHYDRICVGLQYDEMGLDILAKNPGSRRGTVRTRVMNNVFSAAHRGELWVPLDTWREAKPHAVAKLPRELFDLVVTCKQPTIGDNNNIKNCGKCFRCLYVEKIQVMLSQGMSPDEILQWCIDERLKTGVWRGIRQVISGDVEPITENYYERKFKDEDIWTV